MHISIVSRLVGSRGRENMRRNGTKVSRTNRRLIGALVLFLFVIGVTSISQTRRSLYFGRMFLKSKEVLATVPPPLSDSNNNPQKRTPSGIADFYSTPSGTVLTRAYTDARNRFYGEEAENKEDNQGVGGSITDIVLQAKDSAGKLQPTIVHAWETFFPSVLIDSWHRRLVESYDAGEWLFASNNDGRHFGAKVVSNKLTKERKEFALRGYDAAEKQGTFDSFFGYSKWELPRDHPLHLDILAIANSTFVREALAVMHIDDSLPQWEDFLSVIPSEVLTASLNSSAGKSNRNMTLVRLARRYFVERAILGDFFVSLFGKDDYLSAHPDFSLGTVASVAHVAVRRQRGHATVSSSSRDDGLLYFNCEDMERGAGRDTFCVKVEESANQLLSFRTRPMMVSHKVQMNRDADLLRFSFTGWFSLPGERYLTKY